MAVRGGVTLAAESEVGPTSTQQYRSRARALAGFFKKSRDAWKRKYMQLKAELKRAKVRVRDVLKSREKWRARAEEAEAKLSELQAEVERLQAAVNNGVNRNDAPEAEKRGRRQRPPLRGTRRHRTDAPSRATPAR